MNTREALDIKKALVTLADTLGMTVQQVATNVCFLDQNKGDILLEASRLWNEFDDADIKTRGALLGIEITTYDNVADG